MVSRSGRHLHEAAAKSLGSFLKTAVIIFLTPLRPREH